MKPSLVVVTLAVCLAGALVVPAPALPQEAAAAWSDEQASLRPGDILRIDVWPDRTLSGEFTVEESGRVYLPFLGAVPVAGVSIDRLRAQLREGYSEVMREPVVTITPLFRIGVMGAVARPGIYRIDPTNDLLDVLNMAGGFSGNADPEALRIVRPGDRIIEYDLARALEEAADPGELVLRSGDRIVVPQRGEGFSVRTAFEILRTATVTALLIERLVN